MLGQHAFAKAVGRLAHIRDDERTVRQDVPADPLVSQSVVVDLLRGAQPDIRDVGAVMAQTHRVGAQRIDDHGVGAGQRGCGLANLSQRLPQAVRHDRLLPARRCEHHFDCVLVALLLVNQRRLREERIEPVEQRG